MDERPTVAAHAAAVSQAFKPGHFGYRPAAVRLIARRTLRRFWEGDRRYGDARRALEDWHAQVAAADWATPADVKAQYADASILRGRRVVFNVCGNKYRLIVKINYPYRVVYIRFVGTHAQYDDIDAESR